LPDIVLTYIMCIWADNELEDTEQDQVVDAQGRLLYRPPKSRRPADATASTTSSKTSNRKRDQADNTSNEEKPRKKKKSSKQLKNTRNLLSFDANEA
jgi:hypothetical protein